MEKPWQAFFVLVHNCSKQKFVFAAHFSHFPGRAAVAFFEAGIKSPVAVHAVVLQNFLDAFLAEQKILINVVHPDLV